MILEFISNARVKHAFSKLENVEYSSDDFPSIIVVWPLDRLQMTVNTSGTLMPPNEPSTRKSTLCSSAKRMIEDGVNFQPRILLKRCKLDANQNCKELETNHIKRSCFTDYK